MSEEIEDFPRFCHLHVHTYYSLLDGLCEPKKMVDAAVENGFKALAITDHGSCGGILSFQKACKEKGIKPILGNEFYITEDRNQKDKNANYYHLIILAKDSDGIKNLMKLTSIGELEGKYRHPRIDFSILSKNSKGLICSTACSGGELPTLILDGKNDEAEVFIEKYKKLFGEDFYLEVMRHSYKGSNEFSIKQQQKEYDLSIKLHELGKKHGVKVIATNDAHYAKKEDARYQDVLLSIQTLDTIKNNDRFTFDSEDFYIKSYQEMYELFKDMPEVLENTMEIESKVKDNLLFKAEDLLPKYLIPDGYADEISFLKALIKDGMIVKGLIDKPEYRERIKFEMNLIIKCNFVRYFLILWDIISFARQNGIGVGVGRGSACGSLVLFVLGVTKMDSIKYGLLFERFINPERVSPPDVDVDFDYRRDEVFEYIYKKYGADYCCKIGTYNGLKARAVIRGVSKALDLGGDWEIMEAAKKRNPGVKPEESKRSLDVADFIAKLVPKKPNITIEDGIKESPEFRNAILKYPEMLKCAVHIEKTLNSAGVHPAGIIICKNPIVDHVPLRESKGQICSQFTGPEVEELGLLKYDLLAVKTITVIGDTVKMIKERYGKNIDIDALEPNDPKVFALFNGGYKNMDNRGVFQFEAYGISKLVKNVKIDTFDDLAACNALYRPGPLTAGVPDMYADYKNGRKAITYLHPKMGEILKATYGMMVFQEDFMKVSQVLANFTKGQSDTLRKVVGKKKPELIKKEKLDEKFVEGCIKNGIDEKIAIEIFKQIEYFGGYGFNASHSYAYSMIAYQTAWLKIYYPIEFMSALLTSEIDNSDKGEKLGTYFKEAERMGIVIKGANINKSGLKFRIEKGISKSTGKEIEFLRTPFTAIDGIGEIAADSIVKNQPFKDMKDFLVKTSGSKVTIKVFQALVNTGCMDECWKARRSELIADYESIKKDIGKEKDEKKKQQEYISSHGDENFLWLGGKNSDIKL